MEYAKMAEIVIARRRSLGLTQEETASLANIDRRTLGEFENSVGTRGMTVRNLLAICEVLGLTLDIVPFTGRNELS